MTTETKPATDEEIGNAEISATYYGQGNMAFPAPLVIALCRRIDAERERAERFETDYGNAITSAQEHADYTHGVIAERDALAAQLAEARQQIAALREALNEAHPYVEMAEFLGSRAFSYSGGYPEPSPAEWGITVAYVQTAEKTPGEQFTDDVDAYHQMNREVDDGSGEFLTLANKLAALAQTEGAEG